jgi:carbon monoxide dehydrogenase subunit G
MQMQGSRQLAANAEQAWQALNDPEILKACIPGCDRFEAQGEGVYGLGVSIKIGPVSAKFSGKVTLDQVNPPVSYVLHFEAQGGVAGFGKGSSSVKLEPNPEGVLLVYEVSSQVGGKLAQVGQRLIDAAAKSLAEDFFKRFEAALADRLGKASEAGGAQAQPPAAEQSGTSRSIWNQIPRWAWFLLAAAAAAAALFSSPSA